MTENVGVMGGLGHRMGHVRSKLEVPIRDYYSGEISERISVEDL